MALLSGVIKDELLKYTALQLYLGSLKKRGGEQLFHSSQKSY